MNQWRGWPVVSKVLVPILCAGLGVLGTFLVQTLLREKASLYYTKGPSATYGFPDGRYVTGSIELGNDGDTPISGKWTAKIWFPAGAKLRKYALEPLGATVFECTGPGERKYIYIEGQGDQDVINPQERLFVNYITDTEGDIEVHFKGVGATAVNLPSLNIAAKTPDILATALLCLTGIMVGFILAKRIRG